MLASSLAWLAFAVLRVVNVACLLFSLACERPAHLPPWREVDAAMFSCCVIMLAVDIWALLAGAKLVVVDQEQDSAGTKRKVE